jgi:ABC-type transport system involved in multi-copper enzyme maturation permease subunit
MTASGNPEVLFEERQFIGTNKSSLSLRIFLALFCFVAYYYTDVPEINGDLFFVVGIAILVISVILLFITHIHTRISGGMLTLDGFPGSRKVEIPVDSITKAEKTRYSTYFINNPVYNLHRSGIVKFYTGGKDAIRLTDREGKQYLIGTHKPEEFLRVVLEQIRSV